MKIEGTVLAKPRTLYTKVIFDTAMPSTNYLVSYQTHYKDVPFNAIVIRKHSCGFVFKTSRRAPYDGSGSIRFEALYL